MGGRGLCGCGTPLVPPRPIATSDIEADGGKWIETADGRIVEYFVAGSQKPDATVLVDCPGGYMTGKEFLKFPSWIAKCEQLNFKVIGISVPGFGYSTIQPGRKVANWPKDDVAPVLEKEGVSKFVVMGCSLGSVHAMAIAHHFGMRVQKLGLRVPYISNDTCDSLGIARRPDTGIRSEDANSMSLMAQALIGSAGSSADAFESSPSWFMKALTTVMNGSAAIDQITKLQEVDIELCKLAASEMRRSEVHNGQGALWNYTSDTMLELGFDFREIKTEKVAIWYSADDLDCPSEHAQQIIAYLKPKHTREFTGTGHTGGAFLEMPAFLQTLHDL
eukprot:TRINITY_DN24448_c0_g1_i1.p1 TRINITY_DN24448_c0_g1~~TRINITY_DN24448_c0_g1_i1.p1  ORF type:complete len:349 (+),score=46.10 TRINITY_DN24448_c0_g1_i1:50-1048(+)